MIARPGSGESWQVPHPPKCHWWAQVNVWCFTLFYFVLSLLSCSIPSCLKWIVNLRPRGKGRKLAAKVEGGRCGVASRAWGIGQYDAERVWWRYCGDMATIWRRCPKKIATAKLLPNKPGVGGYSIVKFHATGDSSPCPYLAEARGTSASRNWLSWSTWLIKADIQKHGLICQCLINVFSVIE